MSFGAGMAVGMGAGMGAGIGTGIATGQKTARNRIREYAQFQGTTLQDAAGKPLDWDEFLDEALVDGGTRHRTALVLALIGGLALFAAGLTTFYLMR